MSGARQVKILFDEAAIAERIKGLAVEIAAVEPKDLLVVKQAINSISKEPFSRCLQYFLSTCQTLLFTNWRGLVTKEFHFLLALGQISNLLNRPSQVFNLSIPFTAKLSFSGFQLDLYCSFFFFIIFYGLNFPFG